MKTILAIVLAFSITPTVFAQSESSGAELVAIQGALDAQNDFIRAVQKRDFSTIAHKVFGQVIQLLALELRSRNDAAAAQYLLDQWNQTEHVFFSHGYSEIGDHGPLFTWLEDFFVKISDQYGEIILKLPMIQDIRILNFAIPVVFKPNGKWQVADGDNRIEYRKHFIPFANTITYYGSFYGCKYALARQGLSQMSKICGKVADKLKFLMGRYVAAPVSDFIFQSAHRTRGVVNQGEFRYSCAEDLKGNL